MWHYDVFVDQGDQPGTRKLRPSKKRNCPAKIFIVQIAKFPDYKVIFIFKRFYSQQQCSLL